LPPTRRHFSQCEIYCRSTKGGGEHLNIKIADKLDSHKFALRPGLKLLHSILRPEKNRVVHPFQGDIEQIVGLTSAFLQNSEHYANFERNFISYHKGLSVVLKHDDDSVEFAEPLETRPYGMLENLCWGEWNRSHDGDDTPGPLDILIQVLNEFGNAKSISEMIRKKTKVEKGRLKYQFIGKLASQILELLPSQSWLIPDNWVFPWGNAAETVQVYLAICTRTIYHLAALHPQAKKSRLTNGGINQVCLIQPTHELIRSYARKLVTA
jgi:hypothetical protein